MLYTLILANTELSSQRCSGGYAVNAELEERSNMFVAGDAACFFDPVKQVNSHLIPDCM